MFSGGIELEHWLKMGSLFYRDCSLTHFKFNLLLENFRFSDVFRGTEIQHWKKTSKTKTRLGQTKTSLVMQVSVVFKSIFIRN